MQERLAHVRALLSRASREASRRPLTAAAIVGITATALVAGICSRGAAPESAAGVTPSPAGAVTASATGAGSSPPAGPTVAGTSSQPPGSTPVSSPGSATGPTSAPTGSSTAASPPTSLPAIQIAIPACSASPPGTFVGGAGTIPGPTPTPLPTPAPRSPEELRLAVTRYAERMAPIVETAGSWPADTDREWPGATPGRQADLLRVESTRMATLCTATSGVEPDYVLRDVHGGWVAALESRQRWASEAAHALGCCGTADTAELNALRAGAGRRVADAARTLAAGAANYGVTLAADHGYEIANDRLRIAALVPAGWAVARNDTQVALVAPRMLQMSTAAGLGVDDTGLGTGLRVRRLRKQDGWTLDAAADQAKAALSNLGEERSRRGIEQFDGPAVELLLAAHAGEWLTRLIIAGAGEYVYFVEMACPAALEAACVPAFDDILSGLSLATE